LVRNMKSTKRTCEDGFDKKNRRSPIGLDIFLAIFVYSTSCLRQRTFPNINQTHLVVALKSTMGAPGSS